MRIAVAKILYAHSSILNNHRNINHHSKLMEKVLPTCFKFHIQISHNDFFSTEQIPNQNVMNSAAGCTSTYARKKGHVWMRRENIFMREK